MNVSSISGEIGIALQPVASTKRADTEREPAMSAEGARSRSEQADHAIALGSTNVFANRDQARGAVAPIINGQGLGLKFSVDKETGIQIITVVDTETGEVVRQIPPDEVLNFLHQFEDRKGSLLSIKS